VKRIYVRQADRNQKPAARGDHLGRRALAENDVKEVAPLHEQPHEHVRRLQRRRQARGRRGDPPEAVESGVSEIGAPFAEDMVVQYYASEGLFEFEARTREHPATRWAARAVASGKELTLCSWSGRTAAA